MSSLLLLAALCQNLTPQQVAADIGAAGAAGLKRTVTEAVNEYLAPIRERRTGVSLATASSPASVPVWRHLVLHRLVETLQEPPTARHVASPFQRGLRARVTARSAHSTGP